VVPRRRPADLGLLHRAREASQLRSLSLGREDVGTVPPKGTVPTSCKGSYAGSPRASHGPEGAVSALLWPLNVTSIVGGEVVKSKLVTE